MNCQEYRNLIEDTLDVSLHGEPERRVRLHIEHCAACRSYFQSRRNEHIAFFSKINASCADLRLPDGFADRLAASVHARQTSRRGWRRLSLPKWALIAASLVVMAGFVFASVKLIKENVELEGGGEAVEREAAKATGVAEATTVEVVDGAAIDPSVSFVQSTQFENNQKGEAQMSKAKAAAAALSAAFVAAPFAAANGDEYQFIISGDPVAAATAGSSYDYSDTASLTVGRLTNGIVCDSEFEARSRTTDESDTGPLRSDEFKGMVILIK